MNAITARTTALVALAAVSVMAPIAGAAKKHTVKAPKSGKYVGKTHQQRDLTLYISGKEITIAAIQFNCRPDVTGNTSLNSIKLKKGTYRYKFSIKAHGSVGFSDGSPDENAAVNIAGGFSRSARSASGTLRVKSPSCTDTGNVKWSVKR
jgi:hypothetical protein